MAEQGVQGEIDKLQKKQADLRCILLKEIGQCVTFGLGNLEPAVIQGLLYKVNDKATRLFRVGDELEAVYSRQLNRYLDEQESASRELYRDQYFTVKARLECALRPSEN